MIIDTTPDESTGESSLWKMKMMDESQRSGENGEVYILVCSSSK